MRALAALVLCVALSACATAAAPQPEQTATSYLAGTSWRRVDDMNANPHGATLAFTAEGASGYAGCNQWFSAVTHSGEALRFGNIGTTRRACTSEVQAGTERSFLAVLRAARYAHYDQSALVLLDQQQQVIARFDAE